jgi:dihydroneopterin aldolase
MFTIVIKKYVLPCYVGITPQEQGVAQPVAFSVAVELNRTTLPRDMSQTVDYADILEFIKSKSTVHIDMVEEWAQMLADYCLQFKATKRVTIEVEKLAVAEQAESVGVRLVLDKN